MIVGKEGEIRLDQKRFVQKIIWYFSKRFLKLIYQINFLIEDLFVNLSKHSKKLSYYHI